jgi:hypothetical protein
MARITIEISLKDNKLYYQDSESHSGFKIETHVKPEDEIVWFTKPDSGIIDLKNPKITGSPGFFEKEPTQVSKTQWNARVGEIKEGLVTYDFKYDLNYRQGLSGEENDSVEQLNDEDSPILKYP